MASFRRTLDLKNVVFKYAIAYLSHKEIAPQSRPSLKVIKWIGT